MKQIFSFGVNCHLKTIRDKRRTKIEIEKLFSQVVDLRDKNKITIIDENRLKCNFKREVLMTNMTLTKTYSQNNNILRSKTS